MLPRRPATAEPELLGLADLLAMERTEANFILPGFISEGLTVIGGRPKSGKSFLMLYLLVGRTFGGRRSKWRMSSRTVTPVHILGAVDAVAVGRTQLSEAKSLS